MSLVEIPETEHRALLKARELLNGLWSNKKLGSQVRRTVKELDPSLSIPEEVADEAAAPIIAEVEKTKAELAAFKKQIEDRDAKDKDDRDLRSFQQKMDAAAKKYGLTDDGKAGVIKLMQERQVADPEMAAHFYKDSLPKAAPVTPSSVQPSRWNLVGMNGTDGADAELTRKAKLLREDRDAFFDAEVTEILNEAAA